MKKLVTATLVAAAMLIAMPRATEAAAIKGGISFGGAFKPTGGTGLSDATGVDVIGDIAVVSCALAAACTGDYAPIVGLVAATYHDFTFAPLGGSTTPLWSFSFGGHTYSFDLTSVQVTDQNDLDLVLKGKGTLYIDGTNATAGKFSFSGDDTGAIFAFSSTASAPEPASILMLGLGFLGTARAVRRRWSL